MSEAELHRAFARPDPELLTRLAELPVAIVSDVMGRRGAAVGIGPVPWTPTAALAGPAFTLETRPGDNLVVHKALELLQPGDILAIDAGGHLDRAVVGEIIARIGAANGAAGFVVDGAVRDSATLGDCGVPVFARGVCHLGPFKDGSGALHGPISLGGTVVHDGDVLLGDADGVVVVPRDRLEAVATAGEEALQGEVAMMEQIERNELDRSWIDQRLRTVPAPESNLREG